MNKVMLIGNLAKDPEHITTNNVVSLCKFTLAVQRRFSGNDGEREADFLPIIVWRGQAENCYKYLKKGSKAAISGSVQTRSYEATDGSRRYMTEIIADEVEFLASRGAGSDDGSDDNGAEEKKDVVSKFEPIDDDNLPF
ncbi:MAG: single-stranded DNA-binding protein [Clostridia bacterium]|nr:single-stranded DNA-binding protein [Clostridia bacterium]